MNSSFGRSSLVFGTAVIGSNLAQIAWLIAGARAFPGSDFGIVLTAQATYGLLQVIVDNGTGFFGARIAARGDLTDAGRQEVVRARVLLALGCVALGLGISALGGAELLRAFAPFCLALLLFSVLNVWEDYGRGRVLPYAAYLLLRSLVLGVVITVVALTGSTAPVEIAGLCELVAVLVVGIGFSAWVRPRRGVAVSREAWSAIRDIGLPAVLTQYGFAASTILLGVAGRTQAAATCAVAFRLLTGIQAVNGALGAAVFPILARAQGSEDEEVRAGRIAAYGMVALAACGLAVVAALSGVLTEAFLDGGADADRAALILGAGVAGGAALVMHRNFALVASGSETEFRRASVRGAVLVTLAAVAAVVAGGRWSPLVALGGYAVAQLVVLVLVSRDADDRGGMALVLFAGAVLPLTAGAIAAGVAG